LSEADGRHGELARCFLITDHIKLSQSFWLAKNKLLLLRWVHTVWNKVVSRLVNNTPLYIKLEISTLCSFFGGGGGARFKIIFPSVPNSCKVSSACYFATKKSYSNILYRPPNYQIFQAVTWLWNVKGYSYFQQSYAATAGF